MTALNGKQVNLAQLTAEMIAAGINITALGINGDELHTYTNEGEIAPLPSGATAVLAAHVPEASPPSRDEQFVEKLAAGKTALAGATTLDQVKAVFAATLDGLSEVFET